MKSYHEGGFTPRQLAVFRATTRLLEHIPQVVPEEEFRCHEVARIVGRVFDIPVQDGTYGAIDHSWCLLLPQKTGQLSEALNQRIGRWVGIAILDPYAVGRLPPVQLFSTDGLLPGLFRPADRRTDINEQVVSVCLDSLASFTAELKAAEPLLQ